MVSERAPAADLVVPTANRFASASDSPSRESEPTMRKLSALEFLVGRLPSPAKASKVWIEPKSCPRPIHVMAEIATIASEIPVVIFTDLFAFTA